MDNKSQQVAIQFGFDCFLFPLFSCPCREDLVDWIQAAPEAGLNADLASLKHNLDVDTS